MATEDNLRDRAKEIRGAFEPSSVTNEAVGGLLLDIINFFIDYGGNGGGGGKPDARYWSKEELKMLDQYLYVLNDKIKALYADSAGDSELFKGHKWEDYFDQPIRTYDPVEFKSVTSTDFESKLKGWVIDALGNAEFRDVLLRSFKSWNFAAGPLGAGVGMVNDDELQTDKLLVRKIMYVLEMMIQRMRFQGGIMVLSPATGFKIDRVETFDTYYRVYCRPEDFNEFEVNDQARIQNFNGNNIKYLWSLVLSRGDDYIDISRVDKDGDGVPAEGDEIVQLGNRTNPDRQDAVLLSAVNGEVGIFTYYGINSFDLSSKEGSWLGKHGGKKGAVIRGEVHITAGSSGLEQFDEYEDVDKRIQDAKDLADSIQDVVNNLTSIIIPDMQGQIDGSIMSHEGKVPPTLTNEPAVNWTTEEEKNRHIGDYYDYYLTVDGEQVTERYKFSKVNGTYQWVRVADSGSALAASVAREALGLAGTKATITWGNTLPEAPYNINDMWIKLDGSMYICNHQRLDGETGSQSDWQLFNDTMLRLAKMADDNVITKEEKATLRDTWNQIQKEFTAYQAQATKYGVSITALQNAYNTLNTFLTNTVKIAQDIDSNLSVAQKTEYNQDFANYYSERTAFANVIAQKVADESVGNLQIGMVNLLKGSNVELGAQAYQIGRYAYDVYIQENKEYTCVICYTLGSENTYIGVYTNSGSGIVKQLNQKGSRIVESFTFKAPVTPAQTSFFDFYQFPNGTYGSKVHWVVLVEGNKGPNAWIPSLSEQGETAAKDAVDNLQIGGINLADYSGGDFLDVLGLYTEDRKYAIKTTIDGKSCLKFDKSSTGGNLLIFAPVIVENAMYTFSIWIKGSEKYNAQVYHYDGSIYEITTVHVTTSWERKVITFTAKAGSDIIHFRTKNTIYITDWKYEKGNKVTDWSPSIADQNRLSREIAKAEAELAETKANAYADGIVTEAEQNAINEAQARLDALKIGSVNLVSRKMMLAWNEKNKDIAVWGQDSDGIYLSINPALLYNNTGNGTEDIFLGENKYKANTQYVFSIDWKTSTTESTDKVGLTVYVAYTDGSSASLLRASNQQTTKKRTDYITEKGKTIRKIFNSYGYGINCRIYSLALYEGNKVLAEPPVATEDLTGQSNVNLVDGGKEVTVTSSASDQWGNRILVIPKLKPNTVYYLSFNAANLTGSPTEYSAILYNKETKTSYFRLDSVSGGIMITPNNFTEGEATLLLYAGKGGSTAGNSVKFTDVMLVEGFTPPSSYSPSPGDVAKDIKDVSDAVTSLQNFTDQAFADGIITRSEAQAIASNINVLNAEKADIDAYYTKLYANAYLTGTAKTNLASAKTAYNTAHANLINSINTAIADGKTTATEKADVDAKFSAYNNALSAYQTKVGEADKAIQDTIKKVADDAQTSANTAQSAANAAQSTANQAQADANAANSKLTTWASDNYISPQEKTALRQQKSDIQAEYNDIVTNANRYNISSTSYSTAYNSAISALNKYTATSPENIAVSSDYNNISAYYPARQTILNSIATAAKAQVDGVVDTIDKVTTEFNTKIDQKADSVTVSAMRTDLNSLGQVVNQQGSQLQVNTNSIDAIVTKNGSGTIVSIKPEMVEITGTTVIQDGNGNKVHIFGIGDKVISVNGGMFSVDGNGKVIMQNAEIAGKVTAKIGQIGPFTIEELWLRGNNLAMSGSQLNYSYSGHQVYVGSHPDMTTAGGTKLGTFMLSGGGYGGLESDKQVALIVGAPSNNNSYALALTSGLALIKGQVIFDKPTVSASSVVTIGFNSGHFVMLTTITGNSVVSVSAGLPVGSWFLIGQATAAGGYYYIKLSGSERFQRRGNAYQQVNSHNQDPSLIFKISSTSWLIGNLPVNWIDWN